MSKLIFITGGARSGKSDFAQATAARLGGDDVLFVATAQAFDDEMIARISAHRRARPNAWRTVEAPRNAARSIQGSLDRFRVVVVDCLTLLVGNVLLSLGENPAAEDAEKLVSAEIAELLDLARPGAPQLILVGGEVGWGVVPPNALARLFRDLLGRANQAVAARADSAILMVAGIPVDLKALPPPRLD